MKILSIILGLVVLTGCSTTISERRKERIFDCSKDLIENDIPAKEAEEVCSKIFRPKKKVQE